jgi:hypothetical protein
MRQHERREYVTSSIVDLQLGISEATVDYRYTVIPQADGMSVLNTAASIEGILHSYTGAVFLPANGQLITGICETDAPSSTPPAPPTLQNGVVICPLGSSSLIP